MSLLVSLVSWLTAHGGPGGEGAGRGCGGGYGGDGVGGGGGVGLGGGTGVSVAFRYLLRYMKTQYQDTIQKIPES